MQADERGLPPERADQQGDMILPVVRSAKGEDLRIGHVGQRQARAGLAGHVRAEAFVGQLAEIDGGRGVVDIDAADHHMHVALGGNVDQLLHQLQGQTLAAMLAVHVHRMLNRILERGPRAERLLQSAIASAQQRQLCSPACELVPDLQQQVRAFLTGESPDEAEEGPRIRLLEPELGPLAGNVGHGPDERNGGQRLDDGNHPDGRPCLLAEELCHGERGRGRSAAVARNDDGAGRRDGARGGEVLDVREPQEYEAGHVPGAVNVPTARNLTAASQLMQSEMERVRLMSWAQLQALQDSGQTEVALVNAAGIIATASPVRPDVADLDAQIMRGLYKYADAPDATKKATLLFSGSAYTSAKAAA